MKYVFNKGRYAQSFTITVNSREKKVAFDRRRIYLDTGNIATSGITEVEDNIYNLLLKNKRFKELIDSKEFELIDEKELKASVPATDEALVKENKKLVKEAEKAVKAKEEVEAQLSAKDAEINSLKAQLEALTNKESETNTEAETIEQGF